MCIIFFFSPTSGLTYPVPWALAHVWNWAANVIKFCSFTLIYSMINLAYDSDTMVPIRNFLARKNWQADQGVFWFLSAPLLLIPHRHLLPTSWSQLWIPSSRAFSLWPQWVCCCLVLPLSTETFWSCCLLLQGHNLPIFKVKTLWKKWRKRSPGFSLPSQDTAFNMNFLKPLSLSFSWKPEEWLLTMRFYLFVHFMAVRLMGSQFFDQNGTCTLSRGSAES